MRKLFYILLFIIISLDTNAQITIGGERAWGTFMIDGARDDAATGNLTAAQEKNNLFVDSNGKIGIGTVPHSTSSLWVNGSVTIRDGKQAQDRLLVSDADGKASWQSVGGLPFVRGVFHPTGLATGLVPNFAHTNYYMGNYIDLPPGTYAVTVFLLIRSNDGTRWATPTATWLKITLSDSPANFTHTPDFVYTGYAFSGSMNVGSLFGIVKGMLIIRNSTAAVKRYYMVSNIDDPYYGGSTLNFEELPDNKFYAIRLGD